MYNVARYLGPLFAALLGILSLSANGWAVTDREEILVGRIAHIEGDLMRYVEETKDWTLTVADAPFGLEDALYSGNNAKAEMILPNETWMRIGEDTQVQMIDLNGDATTVDVASGLARFYNRSRDVVIKATTPFGYVVGPAGSAFDLYVGDESLEVISVRGEVDFVHEASGTRYPVRQGGNSIIADRQTATTGNGSVDGPWEDWNNQRESVWAGRQQQRTSSANLLPAPIREDAYALEENGRWERVYYDGDYRDLWRPTRVDDGWRPFTNGRWVDYYGDNCWIPSESFGYVTHHYGSWVYVDAFRAWYWMPPAPRRPAYSRPGLTISFGWYPGRVGWFHHGRDIGWVPLAPNEDYYGYRHWGHRTKVIRHQTPMINLSRYHYLNHASIIDRDHLYRGDRYPRDIRRDVNKTVIINQYKPVTQWNDFRQDKRRFDVGDRHIDRKPHVETVERIRENDRRRKEIDRLDRGRIERDLQQVKVSREMPTRTDIRPPTKTSKIVDADKRTAPLDRGSLPTREFKPKERERAISSDSRHGFDASGAAERRPEGRTDNSDRFNRRPPKEQESQQRLRSPRDRQVEESGNRSLGESQQQERQRGPRDPQELRRSREEQRSGDGQRPTFSGEQQRQGRDGRQLPGRGETEQVRPQRPEKAEAEGESREGLSTGGRDRFNRPTNEVQRQGQQGLEAGERQRPERPERPELQRQAEQEQPPQRQFDRKPNEQQGQQQQAEQVEQRRRQGEERLQQREQQETLQRRQDEGLRRQQEQDRKSQAEAREQEMQRDRQQQLRQQQEQQDQQQELQRRQQREADDRQQQRLQQQREQSQQQEMMQRRQQESERQQQETLRNRQAEERQQEAQREQQQQMRRQQEQQQQEMQRRQQQEAERNRQQEMRRQQEQAQREQQQQMRRQQEQQQQEMQRRQQQEAERSRQQEMRRQQEQAQREQQQQLRRQQQEQQEEQRRQLQQQEQQRKKKVLTPEELQKLNQGN